MRDDVLMLAFPQVATCWFSGFDGMCFSASYLFHFFDSYFKISRICCLVAFLGECAKGCLLKNDP